MPILDFYKVLHESNLRLTNSDTWSKGGSIAFRRVGVRWGWQYANIKILTVLFRFLHLTRAFYWCRNLQGLFSYNYPKRTRQRSDINPADCLNICSAAHSSKNFWVRFWVCKNKKRPEMCVFTHFLAERVGFEPTVDLHPRLISSQVHSTTLPPLRVD